MERVVITGLGVISPVGNSKEEFWASLAAGKSGINRVTYFDPEDFRTQIGGEVKGFEPEAYLSPKAAKRFPLVIQYALVAAMMAQQDADLDLSDSDPYRAGVGVGSGIGGISVLEDNARALLEKGAWPRQPVLCAVRDHQHGGRTNFHPPETQGTQLRVGHCMCHSQQFDWRGVSNRSAG